MSTDYSNFDRQVDAFSSWIESAKDKPNELTQKIEIFLKENQPFLAAHKQEHHVQEQLHNLAGRIQATFPKNSQATGWATHLHTIASSPLRVMEFEEFTSQVNALKHLISAEQGPMSPKLWGQIREFVENPRMVEFVKSYPLNPEIGRQFIELSALLLRRFPGDEAVKILADDLHQIAIERRLPPELTGPFLTRVPPKEIPQPVSKEWEALSIEGKIAWINEHRAPITLLGFKTIDQLLRILEQHGSKLQVFNFKSDPKRELDLTDQSFGKILEFCPHLQVLILENCREMSHIPVLPQSLIDLRLSGLKTGSCAELPPGLISLQIESMRIGRLLPLPLGLKNLRLKGLPYLQELPLLPEGLISLSLSNLPVSRVPRLPKTLERFNLAYLDALTELPEFSEGLKFLRLYSLPDIGMPPFPPHLEDLDLSHMKFNELPPFPPELRRLNLTLNENLSRLTDLPNSLRVLILHYLPRLVGLPTLPDSLDKLVLVDLPELALTDDFQLPQVQSLQIRDVPGMDDVE